MKFGEKALKGIEVNIYQGSNGTWHASVLCSRDVFPADDGHPWYVDEPVSLPKRGNRPLVDSGSNRWWYDMSVGLNSYHKHHPNYWKNKSPRTSDEALRTLICEVAALVSEIVPGKDEGKILAAVTAVPVRAHGDWR